MRSTRAFTLVELLVVMAIIGILVSLMLPALSGVREAARKTDCKNQLHQIGLALQAHLEARGHFPIGGEAAPNGAHGYSWWVEVLPFMEQDNLYEQLDRDPNASSWGWSGNVPGAGNVKNRDLLYERALPYGYCPSSPLPKFTWPHTQSFNPTYTGISGAYDADANVEVNTGGYGYQGHLSDQGILIRHVPVKAAHVRDGLTNTLAIGEQSDWCRDASGTLVDCRSGSEHGFQMGAGGSDASGDMRLFNTTTVRHRLNEKSYNAAGVGESANYGANRPIQSAHSGGAFVAMADGSVQFLQDGVEIDVFYNLANRADGQAVTLEF
ncbi:MAG: DUF1559 domain-containing protein [Pirellulales bacterium]|nr:DUF1559 domain-containing protein [Pirellulales bacterium]